MSNDPRADGVARLRAAMPDQPNPTSLHDDTARAFVLAVREGELLKIKGPCSNTACRLHYAHSGPCDCGRDDAS